VTSVKDHHDREGATIPLPAVHRLPAYLRALETIGLTNKMVSSAELGLLTGVSEHIVRRDLSHLGSFGMRGIGYKVDLLRFQIAQFLGRTRIQPIAIIGAGNLGKALAGYAGLRDAGFKVALLVDKDPAKVGSIVRGLRVAHLADLPRLAPQADVRIGVIATSPEGAMEAADVAVASEITSILNFAPVRLVLPDGVVVRRIDLAAELEILAFYLWREAGGLLPGSRA